MKINAVKCSICNDIIYSRAHHDWHRCTCGDIFVGGGREYLRIGWGSRKPKTVEIEVNATDKELYDDWNYSLNKYGVIKGASKTNDSDPI